VLVALSPWRSLAAEPAAAAISGIRTQGTNLLVTVRYPAGARRVVLESRGRFLKGTWTPRAVVLPGLLETESEFTLPMAESSEAMRAVVDDAGSLPLPVDFYAGLRDFEAEIRNTQPASNDPLVRFGTVPGTPESTTLPGSIADSPVNRPVSESDIWKFSGSTLYFYNQLRGLQVIDVSNPAAPVLRGRLPLASYGEQMHVLPAPIAGGDWLALLTQPECRWDATAVQLVRSVGGRPEKGPNVELPGRMIESRLIGDVLVLATQGWTNRSVLVTNVTTGNGFVFDSGGVRPSDGLPSTNVVSMFVSEAFTLVSSVDLSDPAAPVVRSSIRSTESPTAIHATDRLLFVAKSSNAFGWFDGLGFGQAVTTNFVEVFDVSDRSGLLRRTGSFSTSGRVADKFKFGLDGEVLTVVSQVDGRWNGNAAGFQPPRVVLETFSMSDPAAPVRLGQLNLVTNENVFATRYDAGRAYVVTFRQVDPLWIVDLADPARPVVRGELEVPGWSTYIEPMGDRLLAMGAEGGRAAVSLFDVSNPSVPALLDKVFLGDGWSWSEANADEKAFRVFADRGMVLLPWHGLRGTNEWFQGMQLMEFGRDSLTLRGTVSHEVQARRATLIGEHVLSLSSGELVSAGIADPDHPVVRTVLDLSRPVDRVFVHGDRLVQVASGRWTGGAGGYGPATVGLSASDDPDTLLSSLELDEKPLVGAAFRDGLLHVLRRGNDSYRTEPVLQTNNVLVWRAVPPILRTFTNEVVTREPQQPIEVCTETVRTVEIPASPGSPSYLTNVVVRRCTLEPGAPLLVTNRIVVQHEEWQPSFLETNLVVVTNLVSVRVPGETVLDVVRVEGSGLSRLGSVSLTNSLEDWAASGYQAHWTAPGVLVFVGQGSGYAYYAMADFFGPTGRIFPWGFGWGGTDILAFDVSSPAAPKLASRLELPRADQNQLFVADGKLFAGLTTSEWVPPLQVGTNRVADLPPWWVRQGSWHTHHTLTVVDFTDATEPVVRAKVPLPGELVGLSHGGHLLYSRTNAWSVSGTVSSSLMALAYDGVGASRVATRDLPDLGAGPLWIRADGRILVGSSGRPVVETWALSREGTLETYGSIALPVNPSRFFEVGPLLVVEGELRMMTLDPDPAGAGFRVSGTADRACSVWLDASTAAAAGAAAMWIPRGDSGLWPVSFQAP
jgi:hypothetical protein